MTRMRAAPPPAFAEGLDVPSDAEPLCARFVSLTGHPQAICRISWGPRSDTPRRGRYATTSGCADCRRSSRAGSSRASRWCARSPRSRSRAPFPPAPYERHAARIAGKRGEQLELGGREVNFLALHENLVAGTSIVRSPNSSTSRCGSESACTRRSRARTRATSSRGLKGFTR